MAYLIEIMNLLPSVILTKNWFLSVAYVQKIVGHTKIRSRESPSSVLATAERVDLDSTGGINIEEA